MFTRRVDITLSALALILPVLSSSAFAVGYTFDGGPGGTGTAWFSNPNWNPDGIPNANADTATINAGFSVDFTNSGNTERIAWLEVNSGATLNVANGTLDTVEGPRPNTTTVNGGQINIENGGTLQMRGGGAHISIIGGGKVTVEDGGSFAPFKFFRVDDGMLEFLPGGGTAGATGASFNSNQTSRIQANGILAYQIDGTAGAGVLDMQQTAGNPNRLNLNGSPNLQITLTGSPFDFSVNDSWDLIKYENLGGQFAQGTSFTNAQNHQFSIDYGIGNANDTVTLTLTTIVIPEPATLLIWSLLAGLGIGLGWRRRTK